MKANEQFLQRDFNPQDKQPMTAYGQALPFATFITTDGSNVIRDAQGGC